MALRDDGKLRADAARSRVSFQIEDVGREKRIRGHEPGRSIGPTVGIDHDQEVEEAVVEVQVVAKQRSVSEHSHERAPKALLDRRQEGLQGVGAGPRDGRLPKRRKLGVRLLGTWRIVPNGRLSGFSSRGNGPNSSNSGALVTTPTGSAQFVILEASCMAVFTLAHLSDLHLSTPKLDWASLGSAKRVLAALSWKLRKRQRHDNTFLDLVVEDLRALRPDAVVITGDLTQTGHPREILEAGVFVDRLASEFPLALVPGNHDATAEAPTRERLSPWARGISPSAPAGSALFPTCLLQGRVMLIGLSTANPTPLPLATGEIGSAQLAALRRLLAESAAEGHVRVIFLHHPPEVGPVSHRKRLVDAPALGEVLLAEGAELVLHGHAHRAVVSTLGRIARPIPIAGAPSLTETAHGGPAYLVHRIEPHSEGALVASVQRIVRRDSAFTEFPIGHSRPPWGGANPIPVVNPA